MPLPQVFGERLRLSREKRGYTQRQLAKKVGCNQSWISRLETGGQTSIYVESLLRFCQALHVSADYLLGRRDR